MSTRKLYIDSLLCSGTGSDFVYNLKQSVECAQGTAALIDVVLCPTTFMTVDANRRHLYLKKIGQTSGTGLQQHRAEIPERGTYNGITLAAAIRDALNQVKVFASSYSAAYSELAGRIAIHNSTPGSYPHDNR